MPCYVRRPFALNVDFVGQTQILKTIDDALSPRHDAGSSSEDEAVRLFALCGYGGLGKTQIALQYTYEHAHGHDGVDKSNAFDAIFILQADTKIKLASSFERVARALNLISSSHDMDSVVIRSLVVNWLLDPQIGPSGPASTGFDGRSKSMASWLVVLDNLDDLTVVDEFWDSLMEAPRGSILITSRDPYAKSHLASGNGLDLSPMSVQDCSALIQNLSPKSGSSESARSADELAQRVGCIPLAASQLAALLQRLSMDPSEFLVKYGEGSLLTELAKIQSLPSKDRYKKTLATVWAFEKFDGPALSLISLLAFLDPDSIAESILEQALPVRAVSGYPRPGKEGFDAARTELVSRSLVSRDIKNKSLTIHRLVQDVGRERLEDNSARQYFALAVQLLFSAWEFQKDRFSRESFKRSGAEKVLPHVRCILKQYERYGAGSFNMDLTRQYVTLLAETAWYLVQRVEYDSAGPIFNQCLSICESNPDEFEDILADTVFSYARYGEEINMSPEAVFHSCKRYHELCKKRNDGTIARLEDLATSHTSYAQGYLLLDDYQAAIKHCQECIKIENTRTEIIEGKEFPQFSHIFQAWGLYGLGRYDEAEPLLNMTVAFRERMFGKDDTDSPKLGFALQLLAMVQQKLEEKDAERPKESHNTSLRALANLRETLSEKSFRVGQVCLKLAEHHAHANQPEAALAYFEEARDIFEAQPYYKPELARACYKQACFYDHLGTITDTTSLNLNLHDKAERLYRSLKPDHPANQDPTEQDYDQLVRFWSR